MKVLTGTINSGDIAVSEQTFHRLMKISDDSNAAASRAYSKSTFNLWDQNLVNGEYIIAFELNPGLHHKIRSMLPKVSSRLRLKKIQCKIVNLLNFVYFYKLKYL